MRRETSESSVEWSLTIELGSSRKLSWDGKLATKFRAFPKRQFRSGSVGLSLWALGKRNKIELIICNLYLHIKNEGK